MILKKGQIVKLKTLTEVCRMQNVSHWTHITNPVLNSKGMMSHYFGYKIKVAYSSKKDPTFSAYGVGEDGEQQWSFNKDWIEANRFEMEMIQDDLFEI